MSSYSNSKRTNQHNGGNFSARQYFKDNLRVLRRNLLFCSGLPLLLTQSDLKSDKYFGKYGRVIRITQLKNMRQMSVYVTYSDAYEASLAIIATNDFELDRYHKLASIYGTIKYCKYFLKKIECKNLPNCNYLHVYDKKNEIYINNQLPDEVFEEHYAIAMRVFSGVDVKMLIKQKRLKANNGVDDLLPCAIETLEHIIKQRKHYLSSSKSQSSEEEYMSHRNNQVQDEESEQERSLSSASHSSEQEKDNSEEGTSQTIILQTIERDGSCQEFPKIGNDKNGVKKERYREKSTVNKKQQDTNLYLTQIQQQQQQQGERANNNKRMTSILQLESGSISNSLPVYKHHPYSPNSQTLQIKLIRRLLRQPKSKIHSWRTCEQQQSPPKVQAQIQLFHKQLSELNQLRELCENNILREKSMEEQRVKFLLIKNIHYNKKHCHIPPHYHCHSNNRGHVVQ